MARTTTASAQTTGPAEHEAHIRRLVESERVGEARQYLEALTMGLSPQIEAWRRALAPAEVRLAGRATGKSMRPDADWLRQHAAEFADQWVLLRDGELVDSDASQAALLRRSADKDGLVLVHVPQPAAG